jgi:hypothetical protein
MPLPPAGAGFQLRASSEKLDDTKELYYELSL